MSKSWKSQPRGRQDESPQKAIDRIYMSEAKEAIREALTSKEAVGAK